jgi:hypothetical protein
MEAPTSEVGSQGGRMHEDLRSLDMRSVLSALGFSDFKQRRGGQETLEPAQSTAERIATRSTSPRTANSIACLQRERQGADRRLHGRPQGRLPGRPPLAGFSPIWATSSARGQPPAAALSHVKVMARSMAVFGRRSAASWRAVKTPSGCVRIVTGRY